MALFLISYDINEKNKEEYEPLWAALREMGAVKILYSEWVVSGGPAGAVTIYNKLSPIIKSTDRLLVQEVTLNSSWDRLLISDDEFTAIVRANARR
jgi:hypothetical protein